MVPKLVKSGVSNNSVQGRASSGPLNVRREFLGIDSLDDVIGGFRDVYDTVNGNTPPTVPTPPKPAAPSALGGLMGSPALLAVAALLVVVVLFFALRRK